MTTAHESAQAVFERINRRRNRLGGEIEALKGGPASTAAPLSPDPATAPPPLGGEPLRVDEVLFSAPEPARHHDTFPRSATMRFILKNPALALGVGVPAAALLLASPAARRVVRLALEAGTRPGVPELIGLSSAAVRLIQSQGASTPSSPVDPQKKAP